MNNRVILYLIDSLNIGGAERSLLEIVSRLTRFKPVICHLYPGESLKKEFEARGIETISLNIPPPYNWNKAEAAVRGVVEKVKPAVIHSTLFKSDVISRRVAPAFHIPLVNSLVNNSYHRSRFRGAGLIMKMKLLLLQWTDARTARKVDLFISNSETIRQSNAKALHIPLGKITVIYRGRTIEDYNISKSDGCLKRQELGLTDNEPVVLNVSRLIFRKGQIELIGAFKGILAEHPKAILLIAGDGHYLSALKEEIGKQGIDNNVKILGNRKDIPLLMKAADCFVFPSHYEGLPGVLIEAMLSGLPIAASRIKENLECVDDNSAYFFEPGDVAGIAVAVNTILKNKTQSQNKVGHAYKTACDKFDIVRIVKLYEDAYDDLLSAARKKAIRSYEGK